MLGSDAFGVALVRSMDLIAGLAGRPGRRRVGRPPAGGRCWSGADLGRAALLATDSHRWLAGGLSFGQVLVIVAADGCADDVLLRRRSRLPADDRPREHLIRANSAITASSPCRSSPAFGVSGFLVADPQRSRSRSCSTQPASSSRRCLLGSIRVRSRRRPATPSANLRCRDRERPAPGGQPAAAARDDAGFDGHIRDCGASSARCGSSSPSTARASTRPRSASSPPSAASARSSRRVDRGATQAHRRGPVVVGGMLVGDPGHPAHPACSGRRPLIAFAS